MAPGAEAGWRSGVYVASSPIHGRGVYAAIACARGQTVLVLDDSRVADADHPLDPARGEFDHHCDSLAAGATVLMPEPERHINSSCDPNTYVVTRSDGRHVVALRAIDADSEITYDYMISLHGGVTWACGCGATTCRGIQPSSFFDLPREVQLRYRPLLDRWFVEEHSSLVAALDGDSPG
jgi:hypothetical protein